MNVLRLLFVVFCLSSTFLGAPQSRTKPIAGPEPPVLTKKPRPREPQRPASPTPSEAGNAKPATKIQWQPIIEMGGMVFPSFILATANDKREPNIMTYVGDPNGVFGFSIVNPAPNTRVIVSVSIDEIAKLTEDETELPLAGATYEIFPYLDYRYDVLSRLRQPMPANITFRIKVNNGATMIESRRVQIRPLNECPYAWADRSGQIRPFGWMFAAYVNEDHPWIDGLLNEALRTGAVPAFIGYQGTQDDVFRQVYAIWNILQRRGFRYSNIVTTSIASSNQVHSQYVRFFSNSVGTSQANCVDGSVVFASVMRRIGLDPSLVLIPGHCFVGFWLDPDHRSRAFIETTMLGQTNLRSYSEDGTLAGSLAGIFGNETKNQASYRSFVAAVAEGNAQFNRNFPILARSRRMQPLRSDPTYQVIEIAEERKRGISPIGY